MPTPYDRTISPLRQSREAFVEWIVKNLRPRSQNLCTALGPAAHNRPPRHLDQTDIKAYLLTPREEFVTVENLHRAYELHHPDIGFGVTITGPHTVARMTNTLSVRRGDTALQIGTARATSPPISRTSPDRVLIEIIPGSRPAHARPLRPPARPRLQRISRYPPRNADGYYGWEEFAPFDKIIVTCGIDHIPPPLLEQLTPHGIMVIPVEAPGRNT